MYCASVWDDFVVVDDIHFTLEDAKRAGNAKALEGLYGRFYTCTAMPYFPHFDANKVFAQLREDASDVPMLGNCPALDEWLEGVTAQERTGLENVLTDALVGWMASTGHIPKFYRVTDVEEHVTENFPIEHIICSSGKPCPTDRNACLVAGKCVGRTS